MHLVGSCAEPARRTVLGAVAWALTYTRAVALLHAAKLPLAWRSGPSAIALRPIAPLLFVPSPCRCGEVDSHAIRVPTTAGRGSLGRSFRILAADWTGSWRLDVASFSGSRLGLRSRSRCLRDSDALRSRHAAACRRVCASGPRRWHSSPAQTQPLAAHAVCSAFAGWPYRCARAQQAMLIWSLLGAQKAELWRCQHRLRCVLFGATRYDDPIRQS